MFQNETFHVTMQERGGAMNNPKMTEQTRLAIEHVLLSGWVLVFEPGNGPERKHPRFVVMTATGDVVASAKTQEQAVFKAWMGYIFTDA
jgi:hypothetical protein